MVDEAAVTYWEHVARTRWGTYLSASQERALLEAARSMAPARALEVGCEGGRWSRLLTEEGWKLVCTDVDARALDLCRARLPDAQCVLVQPSDTTFPVDDQSVRLLLVSEVPPVIEAAWFPHEAARVLEPNGKLVFTYDNSRSLRGFVVRRRKKTLAGDRYYEGRPYGEFRSDLRRTGFDVISEEGLGWLPFNRRSNSALVEPFVAFERWSGLTRLPTLAGRITGVAQKRK